MRTPTKFVPKDRVRFVPGVLGEGRFEGRTGTIVSVMGEPENTYYSVKWDGPFWPSIVHESELAIG